MKFLKNKFFSGNFLKFATIINTVSNLEVFLIYISLIPVILSYSIINILFGIARIGITALYVYSIPNEKFGKRVLKGTCVYAIGIITIIIGAIIGKEILGISVLGLETIGNISAYVLMGIILIENIIVGAVISAVVSWLKK